MFPLLCIVLVGAGILAARLIAHWIANRPDEVAPVVDEGAPVVYDKMTTIQAQVSSKVLWDAPDDEVIEWLEQKHSITGEAAGRMLATGKTERRRIIRQKALLGMIFSGAGAALFGGLVIFQIMGGFVFVLRSFILLGACGACVFGFFLHLKRFITGKTTSSAGL